jgi:hypothetical protein
MPALSAAATRKHQGKSNRQSRAASWPGETTRKGERSIMLHEPKAQVVQLLGRQGDVCQWPPSDVPGLAPLLGSAQSWQAEKSGELASTNLEQYSSHWPSGAPLPQRT